jgi:hypothetical protein
MNSLNDERIIISLLSLIALVFVNFHFVSMCNLGYININALYYNYMISMGLVFGGNFIIFTY